MAGIGIAAAQGDAPPPQDQQQPGNQAQGEEMEPNVTPEEQQHYDEFVTNAMKLMYQNGEVTPAVLDHLRGKWDAVKPSLGEMPEEDQPLDPKNPTDNLAVATVALILTLEASAASAGKQVEPEVLFHGGAEIAEQMADIAKEAGIHDFTTDELTGAANRIAMLYGVSSKTANKQEALAEFEHFLTTQGENLGASLAETAAQGQQQPPPEQGA